MDTSARPTRGVQATFDSTEKHSGEHSLRLVFDGSRNVNFSDVCHVLQVQPGTSYRFSAWVRTQGLTTDQGIRFRLEWLENSLNASTETTRRPRYPGLDATQPAMDRGSGCAPAPRVREPPRQR